MTPKPLCSQRLCPAMRHRTMWAAPTGTRTFWEPRHLTGALPIFALASGLARSAAQEHATKVEILCGWRQSRWPSARRSNQRPATASALASAAGPCVPVTAVEFIDTIVSRKMEDKMSSMVSAQDLLQQPPMPTRRDFLAVSATAFAAIGVAAGIWPLFDSLNPSSASRAEAKTEVDLRPIRPGQVITVRWQGKPVFIAHRTPEQIAQAAADDGAATIDPARDRSRVKRKAIEKDFDAALAKALKFAKTEDAAYLPGWCGADPVA